MNVMACNLGVVMRRAKSSVGIGVLGLCIAGLSVNAVAQSSSRSTPAPASAPMVNSIAGTTNSSAAIDTANSTIGELQQLMQTQSISELRTTYNGNYGSSLLFKPDSRTYYVALFQQKNFWRVVKTVNEVQAELTYKSFVGQTEKLAEVDIRRIKLEAEKQYTEQLISSQETRLLALQNDLAVQRQQEQRVAVQQDQSRQQAQALTNKEQSARNQLVALRSRIRALEAQQTIIDGNNVPVGKNGQK